MSSFQETQDCLRTPSSRLAKSSTPPTDADAGDAPFEEAVSHAIVFGARAHDAVCRAQFHLSILGKLVHPEPEATCSDSFRIALLCDGDGRAVAHGRVMPTTQVHFVSASYNCVIILDMSTSMASALAEAGSGSVSLDRAFACVTQIVKILIACADYIPHDPSAASSSRILLSIIACDHSNVLRSILHGWPLARDHLPELLRIIDKRLSSLENELSHVHPDPSSNDASFMLASMLLTHDRLPGDRAPISFFVTDGVLTAPDIGTFDNVFTSIAAKDIAVHTVLLHRHSGHFGFIPDPDFLVMISQYSGGVHLSASDLDAFDLRTRESLFGGSYSPLLLRQSALCKSALPFISGAPCSEPTNWGGPLFCLKIKEYLLDVSIGSLLLCRIKEGFKCGQTTNLKGGGFSLSMTLVWKPIVTVDYVIEKRLHENPRVIVKVIAPDEFLRRLQILQKSKKNRGPVMTINSGVAAPPPLVLLERLTNLVKTDQLLILLHSLRPDDITGSTLSTLRQRGEPDLRLVRSLSGTGRNASERSFSASQPPQESPALLKIIAMPPTSWKRWFSVTRLDFFCTSRCRDKKKHRSSCTDFDSNKDIIHAALTTWSSSVHGNLYVKLLAARESLAPQNELDIHLWSAGASKPLPICLARIFWHSNILASLYVGVFTVGGAQADVEIAHIKTLIANCRPSGSGSESEPWIVFPSTPLSPVLLKLDPSDAVFRNDVKRVKFPLESAPLNGNAFVELPSSVSLNTTLLARSRSNPNLASLGMSREVSPVSAAGSSSTTKPPSPQHNDPSRESVESSLPKSVLRSFMYSAQRTYRTQNTEMLRCFFAHINDARHRDGFDLLFADELSFTYCFEISLPTGVSANLQYAVCLVSSVDVLVEVWLDPLDTAEVSCRSLFQTIMDYFDKSDKLTLQSLQVFHSIQDAHRNNVLSLRGSRRVEQSHMNAVFRYSSRSRHSRCAVEDFRVQEFPFDILPLMRNARPCFVPLRFPHGLAVSQTCVLESLCRIPSIVEVVPGACFAQVVDRKTVTLALLTADVDTSVASLASDVKSLMAYAKEILDRLCGDADRRESENIVLIFEVALEDILDSKSELRNVVANLIKSGASAIESNAVYQHECHHSSALNMLRDLIEHLHSIYFAQEVFSNLSHGSNVSDDDVNAVVSSLVDYSNHINITSVICNGADYQAMSASLDKIIRECLRAVTSSSDDWATPTYFIFVDGNEFHNDDAADTDDDSDDLAPNVSRAGSRAEHLLDPSIPDAVPFCMRFEVVVRSDDRVLATIPISSGSSSSAAFDQARQSARDAAQDGTAPVVFMRITCCTFRFREWESYRFGVDPDVSTGLRKSTSMSALSSASTSPISMRRLKLGGFSVLPEPLSKQMARISKQIRSMFADQVLRNLQKQLGTNWSPDNVTEELLTDIQLHMGRLRDTHKLQKRIPIDFVSPGLATASMFLREFGANHIISVHKVGSLVFALRPPPWLLVIFSESLEIAHIVLHNSLIDDQAALATIALVQDALYATVRRVNQITLLNSLHVSRVASPALIPPCETDNVHRSASSAGKFPAGSLSCPCVLTHDIPLHVRLGSAAALETLSDTALHPFTITNRRYVFVIQQQSGSVFYLRICAARDDILRLEVFGVDPPDDEIREELPRLVRTKVASATINILSSLLSRNAQFRMLPDDLSLVRPGQSAPSRAVCYSFDGKNANPLSFMLILSQTLRHSPCLSPLLLSTPPPLTLPLSTPHDGNIVSWIWSDFAFVYNFDERFDVSKQLGNGLAMIFCSLLDESGRVVRAVKPFNNSRDEDVQETLNNPVTIEDIACREGGISVMDSTVVTGIWDYTSKRIAISMEIWMLGAVNIEMLVDLFSQSFKQALSDFRIEWAWNRFDRTPTGSLDMLLVHGQTIENPTVSVTSFGFHLPSYCLASVVKEMVSMITPVCECQVAMSSQENSWVFVPDVSTMTMRHPQVVRIVGRGTGSNEHVLRDNIIGLECAYSGSVAKEAVTHKRCSFVIVTIQRRSIRIVTYNWRPNYTAQLTKQTARLASWTQFRLHLLEAVLHQKLGLFNHVPCHPPAVSKEPVSSKDPPSTVHARFTVDNIATLVEHEVPPRHQIHETSQHLTSPTDLPTVSHHRGGRGRIPNRFEVRRRSQKGPGTRPGMRMHHASGSIVGSPMGSSVPFSSVLRGALPDTSVKLHADPVYQHGQAFLAVAKRLKEVGDSEARREFCTILCETSSGPSSASSAMQLVWIDFTVSNATFLQSCTLPFMFLSETGDAKSPSSWSETFIGQFLSHLQSTSGVSSLLGAIQSPGHHRHLLRRCLEPGKILLIEVLVNPDAATCATHIFDSVTETSSEAAFSTISELTRDIAFEPFMEMFHERFIIDKAQTITHPDFSFFRTLMALSSPSSPYRNVQVASAKGTCELLDLLFSSGDLVPIPSPKPDGFMTRSDGICMLIFRTDPNEVATFCFRRAVCDDLSKLAAQFLNDLLHTCLVRQSASLLWNRLSSNMETSISLTPSEAEAFLQVFDRKDLVDFDPSLGRLLQRVRMVDSELFISEIRSSFRGRCCDLTVSGQPAYLVLCLPKPSDAALFVHVADPYRLEVCARDRSNEHHDQMRSLVIDYVNAACYLLWKMCIPE
ncbi:VWFA domain-containing protein [Plasmodiophora brassicae]